MTHRAVTSRPVPWGACVVTCTGCKVIRRADTQWQALAEYSAAHGITENQSGIRG